MALKRQQQMLATFSMASMTDVVFLLLVFFMVTSSFVFPTALEIDLPQSSQQTPVKPSTRVFVDAAGAYYVAAPDADPVAMLVGIVLGIGGRGKGIADTLSGTSPRLFFKFLFRRAGLCRFLFFLTLERSRTLGHYIRLGRADSPGIDKVGA